MKVEPLGDSAFILRDLDVEPYLVARSLNQAKPAGLIEAVSSYETVGIYVDPADFDLASLDLSGVDEITPRGHTIPVCYELGSDLEEVQSRLGIDFDRLVSLHTYREYTCYALGFCPGFAYLGYLPGELSGLPRLPSPRLAVPPGSVAITGRQTAVYPLERPGGWFLIGRTPLTIVGEDYFPIEAGDTVRFESISIPEYESRRGEKL